MDSYALLVDALGHADRVVQADAARLLGDLGQQRTSGPLVQYVTTSRYHAKTAGFWALAQIGDETVCPQIRPLVDHPNCYDDYYWYGCKAVRATAAAALGSLGDDAGIGYLTELADRGDDVFYTWLGPALLRLDGGLPSFAAIQGRLAFEPLTTVKGRGTRLIDPARLARLAETLGLIATPEACRKLVELLGFRSRYVRGQAAVSLLAASTDAEHVAAVEALATEDPTDFVRIRTAQALATPEPIATLAESAADPFDRAAALEALGLLGDARSAPVAIAALSDADGYVRLCAAEALDRIGGDEAAEAVSRVVDDGDIRVRLQAAKFAAAREGRCC